MTLAPRSQKGMAVIRSMVTTIRAELAEHLAAWNVELTGDMTLPTITAYMITARDEQAIDEGQLPAGYGGVRVRLVESVDTPAVSIGEARTRHVVEVRTMQSVQTNQGDTTEPGTASTGYIETGYLAELVDDIVRSHMVTKVGIYRIELLRGARPESAPRSQPSVHQTLWTYEVWQRTRRPIHGETMAAYSGAYIASADDTQVVVANTAEFIDVASTITATESGITHTSPWQFTVTQAGLYQVMAIATITTSSSNTLIHMEIAKDGVVDATQDQERKVTTGGDIGNMSVRLTCACAAGAVLRPYVKADKNGTITWNHLTCDVRRVDA